VAREVRPDEFSARRFGLKPRWRRTNFDHDAFFRPLAGEGGLELSTTQRDASRAGDSDLVLTVDMLAVACTSSRRSRPTTVAQKALA
jgi:hypothetical protein